MTGALVATGRVTVCCRFHTRGGLGWCCDIADCSPCCPECPTCVQRMCVEDATPGANRAAVRADEDLLAPLRPRWALEDLAAALWWWDSMAPLKVVVRPDSQMLVRSYRQALRVDGWLS